MMQCVRKLQPSSVLHKLCKPMVLPSLTPLCHYATTKASTPKTPKTTTPKSTTTTPPPKEPKTTITKAPKSPTEPEAPKKPEAPKQPEALKQPEAPKDSKPTPKEPKAKESKAKEPKSKEPKTKTPKSPKEPEELTTSTTPKAKATKAKATKTSAKEKDEKPKLIDTGRDKVTKIPKFLDDEEEAMLDELAELGDEFDDTDFDDADEIDENDEALAVEESEELAAIKEEELDPSTLLYRVKMARILGPEAMTKIEDEMADNFNKGENETNKTTIEEAMLEKQWRYRPIGFDSVWMWGLARKYCGDAFVVKYILQNEINVPKWYLYTSTREMVHWRECLDDLLSSAKKSLDANVISLSDLLNCLCALHVDCEERNQNVYLEDTITGYKPPHCTEKLKLLQDNLEDKHLADLYVNLFTDYQKFIKLCTEAQLLGVLTPAWERMSATDKERLAPLLEKVPKMPAVHKLAKGK